MRVSCPARSGPLRIPTERAEMSAILGVSANLVYIVIVVAVVGGLIGGIIAAAMKKSKGQQK